MVCSSSMKTIVWPSSLAKSFNTDFRRSSNSPRNLAPANKAAMSKLSTRLPSKVSGTSPATMRCARPSTIAVLPTPGSPINTGLFLVRRCKTWIARRISSSRPITGSSLPIRARSVKSMQYFFNDSRWSSASALSMLCPPRTASMAASSDLRDTPCVLSNLPTSPLESHKASKNNSLAMNWSPRFKASFSVACNRACKSRPTCTISCPCTCGSLLIKASTSVKMPPKFAPERSSKALGPSSCRSIAKSKCAGSMYALSCFKAMLCASLKASVNFVVSLSCRIGKPYENVINYPPTWDKYSDFK